MKVTPTLAMALALVCGAIVITAPRDARAGHAPAAPPDLRGQWRLDDARSDDPQKKLKEMLKNKPAGPMGGMPPGGGMPGGGMPPVAACPEVVCPRAAACLEAGCPAEWATGRWEAREANRQRWTES